MSNTKALVILLTPLLRCSHVFCVAESIDDELAVLMVQKKHTYKLTFRLFIAQIEL